MQPQEAARAIAALVDSWRLPARVRYSVAVVSDRDSKSGALARADSPLHMAVDFSEPSAADPIPPVEVRLHVYMRHGALGTQSAAFRLDGASTVHTEAGMAHCAAGMITAALAQRSRLVSAAAGGVLESR
jgi:hypothetical protein